jgi:hypothetical protein
MSAGRYDKAAIASKLKWPVGGVVVFFCSAEVGLVVTRVGQTDTKVHQIVSADGIN